MLCAFLLLMTSVVNSELPLDSTELTSIRWLINQYNINWRLDTDLCSEIPTDTSDLKCIDNGQGAQTITKLDINYYIPITNSFPDPNLKSLSFPSLSSFSIEMRSDVRNNTFSLLSLLDQSSNDQLKNVVIDCNISPGTCPFSIPGQFPKFIPLETL
ncbi:hypothetical protein SAMD00019534_121290 [Acytostelium subglobosum LB1]|uniref:hypothetical protein n=1 Tax=Acytostelium subglobosum LB1 TaxID=1410327 RepID=UPI000644B59A|nr:hypothetical protein SAMD00019534_121290 [Acytostelium subglobosum LB1]GAM28953.1 hypothetical protein SAMD00019534_121290 [Acytostelium subglobosum LB1]|eukprot:XP_012748138.1 hypothetical protein SAMD00019534_121290 [Acytostelium subglobosum LB1]